MKNIYKYKLYSGTTGDIKNLEKEFSEMAQKGWMIDKIGKFTHRYRAIEPCKKHFFADLLLQITAFDYPENEDAQDYRRICEESGWTFVTANKQFHVFCADVENPKPIPIHTVNGIQANIYLKACKKYELPMILYVPFMIFLAFSNTKAIDFFSSNITLFMTIGYFLFSFGYIWTFGFVVSWYIKVKKCAENDLPMPKVNRKLGKIRNKLFMTGVIALLVCMIIGFALEFNPAFVFAIITPLSMFFIGLCLRNQIDTKRRTRSQNIKLSVAVGIIAVIIMVITTNITTFKILSSPRDDSDSLDNHDNNPVLTLNDVGIAIPAEHFNFHVKGTPIVPLNYEKWEINTAGGVSTQVYRSINNNIANLLYGYCTEEFLRHLRFESEESQEEIMVLTPEESVFWGAEKGLIFYNRKVNSVNLLLLKDKTILRLSAESVNMDLEELSKSVKKLWSDIEKI